MYSFIDFNTNLLDEREQLDEFDVDFGISFDSVLDFVPSSTYSWITSTIDTCYFIIRRGKLYSARISTPLTEWFGKSAAAMIN